MSSWGVYEHYSKGFICCISCKFLRIQQILNQVEITETCNDKKLNPETEQRKRSKRGENIVGVKKLGQETSIYRIRGYPLSHAQRGGK